MSIIVFILAGVLAGVGIGLVGLSAATIITPMLVTLLGMTAYKAIGVALTADVVAALISSVIYLKNKRVDVKHGIIMMITTMIFTYVVSYFAKSIPNNVLGSVSIFTTILLGLKLIYKPVGSESKNANTSEKKKVLMSILFGALIGTICGTIGVGGGVMILLVLTSFLGYDFKTAVGTSVFIMGFTALTGATAHIIHGGTDITALIICTLFAVIGSRAASKFANKIDNVKLNKIAGVFLVLFGGILLTLKVIMK